MKADTHLSIYQEDWNTYDETNNPRQGKLNTSRIDKCHYHVYVITCAHKIF